MRPDALERQDQVAAFFERNPSASARKASRELGVSPPTILKDMRELGIPVQAKPRRTREQMGAQAREAAALISEGKTLAAIGKTQGHSHPTVHRDLARLGIRVGPRTKYPIPEPRACLTCGEVFTPTRDAAGRGYGRYCSARCRDRSPERIAMLRANRYAARERREAYCARRNLWTVDQAAEWIGRDSRTVGRHVDRGHVPAVETFKEGRRSVKLLQPRDVKTLGKELASGCKTYFADFNDPVDFFAWLTDHGIGKARARELIKRRQDAHARASRARPGAGRPPSPGQLQPHDVRWFELFHEAQARLLEQYEIFHAQGERAPGRRQFAFSVAYEDVEAAPESWAKEYVIWESGFPMLNPKLEHEAAALVLRGVRRVEKSLQNPETEIRAA